MNGVVVIVAYRPKPGKESETLDLVRSRVPTLHKEALVTERTPIIMRARAGTIIEVSEWKSREAIDAAQRIQTSSRCGTDSLQFAIVSRSISYLNPTKCLPVSNRFPTDY
jgi:quinol monooxygenase YgiN